MTAARDRLRQPTDNEEIAEFLRTCLDRVGLMEVVVVSNPGRLLVRNEFESLREADQEKIVIDDCLAQAEVRYPGYFDHPKRDPETPVEHFVVFQLLQLQAECLDRLGYTVRVPSFDSYFSSGGEWQPFNDLPSPSGRDAWEALNEDCPQAPWAYEPMLPNE